MKAKKNLKGCGSRGCEWTVKEGVGSCQPGRFFCSTASLLTAKRSAIHDRELAEATKKINEILKALPKDPQGRKASLLVTNFGVMLGWLKHDAEPTAGAGVTATDDDAKVIEALGLKVKL